MNLRRTANTIFGAAVVTALLAGCGGGGSASSSATQASSASKADPSGSSTQATTPPTTSSTASTKAEAGPVLDLPLKSSVKLEPMSARYTCDGDDISPPITWSKIPPGTAELDLFAFNTNPVHGKNFGDWAVAGLKPSLHGLSAGKLPAGAVVGRGDSGKVGYSICPPKGATVNYLFILYAVPHKIPAVSGFNANERRKQTGNAATHGGYLGFSYKRS
jgi:phosphatidylethanolamine-binding protein (PEBP) family uncharacterized protein